LIEFLVAHGIDVLLPAPGADGAIAWGLVAPDAGDGSGGASSAPANDGQFTPAPGNDGLARPQTGETRCGPTVLSDGRDSSTDVPDNRGPGEPGPGGRWGLVRPAPGRPWEPGGARLGAAALAQALAIVVPALAADLGGTRLGQGGGWYDRALLHAAPGVPVVVLLYPAELLPAGTLPREAHDLPLTHAATPTALVPLPSPVTPTE
jgi:5-formyltetrahydrofolate cyclo-ligase